jgi:hypothetical protein
MDGGEVVSLTRQPGALQPPKKIPGAHFCWRLSKPQGHSAAGRIRSIEKSSELMGNETGDLAVCIVGTLPCALLIKQTNIIEQFSNKYRIFKNIHKRAERLLKLLGTSIH